jgi:RNA polymerase sigma factor (sigma-70 family)
MVLNADDGAGSSALNELCQLYWRPLYAYCCSIGRSSADAEDLTQGYFAQLLNRGALRMADPQRGKFRTFLLSSFKNYLADVHRHGVTLKRGGGAVHLSLDMAGAEDLEPPTEIEPELAFDRQWAQDLVARATQSLRQEYVDLGKDQWFEAVAGEQAGASYAELALRFGSTEEAVKSFALRVRKRFRALLEREIADTVATPEEVAAEMAYVAELLRA